MADRIHEIYIALLKAERTRTVRVHYQRARRELRQMARELAAKERESASWRS
jgi:hypothetical protein